MEINIHCVCNWDCPKYLIWVPSIFCRDGGCQKSIEATPGTGKFNFPIHWKWMLPLKLNNTSMIFFFFKCPWRNALNQDQRAIQGVKYFVAVSYQYTRRRHAILSSGGKNGKLTEKKRSQFFPCPPPPDIYLPKTRMRLFFVPTSGSHFMHGVAPDLAPGWRHCGAFFLLLFKLLRKERGGRGRERSNR